MNSRKIFNRAMTGLAGIALASGLAGCVAQYDVSFEGDAVHVYDISDARQIEVKDTKGRVKVDIYDGNSSNKKDGAIDIVVFKSVSLGSKFAKYRDFKKLNELANYVDTKIKELNAPKAEAQ